MKISKQRYKKLETSFNDLTRLTDEYNKIITSINAQIKTLEDLRSSIGGLQSSIKDLEHDIIKGKLKENEYQVAFQTVVDLNNQVLVDMCDFEEGC